MIKVEPLRRDVWLGLLDGPMGADISPFQRPEWLDHQVRTLRGASDSSLCFRFDDGVIVAVPLVSLRQRFGLTSYWSMAHDEYGGILSNRALHPVHREAIYEYFARECRPIRLTSGPRLIASDEWAPPAPWRADAQSCHLLQLPADYDAWLTGVVSANARRDIRRGGRSGFDLSTEGASADLDAYYALYCASAARWGKSQGQVKSRRYFADILACPLSRLHLVYKGTKPAAGLITLNAGRYAVYYLGASDLSFASLCPVDYGVSEVVRDAIANGQRVLSFGGSIGIESLQKFKEKFGARKHTYNTHDLPTALVRLNRAVRYYRGAIARRVLDTASRWKRPLVRSHE